MNTKETYETMWGFQCQGCWEWYPNGQHQACAGAADGLPIEDIEHSLNRLARAFERIAAALEKRNEDN